MAIDHVRQYFKQYGLDLRILEFDHSSATVSLAAEALHCDKARIAKTLSLFVQEQPILIVTAGDQKIDNHKFKTLFHTKAKMIPSCLVEQYIGHTVGGVCPFAVKKNVTIYLDCSLKRFKTIFPACGSSNSAIELTLEELEQYANYKEWIDVCKKIDPEAQ